MGKFVSLNQHRTADQGTGILGFDLDKRPEYHRIYRLKDETGHEFSDMLETKTKNLGIIEAIREVRTMRLGKTFKTLHDANMKQLRDRNTRDDYVRREGLAEGEDKMNRLVLSLIQDARQDDIEEAQKITLFEVFLDKFINRQIKVIIPLSLHFVLTIHHFLFSNALMV